MESVQHLGESEGEESLLTSLSILTFTKRNQGRGLLVSMSCVVSSDAAWDAKATSPATAFGLRQMALRLTKSSPSREPSEG